MCESGPSLVSGLTAPGGSESRLHQGEDVPAACLLAVPWLLISQLSPRAALLGEVRAFPLDLSVPTRPALHTQHSTTVWTEGSQGLIKASMTLIFFGKGS